MALFGRYLTSSLSGSLGALPAGCFVGGMAFGWWSYVSSPGDTIDLWGCIALGMLVGLVAMVIGIIPTFLYGAPAYAVLAYRKYENFLTSAAIGAVPGVALLAIERELGMLFLMFGIPVACFTHLFSCHRVRQLA